MKNILFMLFLFCLASCYSTFKYKKGAITSNGKISTKIFIGKLTKISKTDKKHLPSEYEIDESYKLIIIDSKMPKTKKIYLHSENLGYAWIHKNSSVCDTVFYIPKLFFEKNEWYLITVFRHLKNETYCIYANYDEKLNLRTYKSIEEIQPFDK